jgi:hypothetical protein
MDKTKKHICCFFCSKELSIEKSNLEEHAKKHPHKIEDILCDTTLTCPIPSVEPTVYNVIQNIHSKQFWKEYVPKRMCVDHTQIYVPAFLIYPSGELVFVTNNIFIQAELTHITEEAKWLDANGNQPNVEFTKVVAGW